MRQYTADFEPAATQPFDDLWERKLTSVQQVKGEPSVGCCAINLESSIRNERNLISKIFLATEEMHKFIAEQLQTGRVPLCINPQSAAFKSFAR